MIISSPLYRSPASTETLKEYAARVLFLQYPQIVKKFGELSCSREDMFDNKTFENIHTKLQKTSIWLTLIS